MDVSQSSHSTSSTVEATGSDTLFDTSVFDMGGKPRECFLYGPGYVQDWTSWWITTPWFQEFCDPDAPRRKRVLWGSDKKADEWKCFREGACKSTGSPYIVCNYCDITIAHPSAGKKASNGNSGMSKHLQTDACQLARRARGDASQLAIQGWRKMVCLNPRLHHIV